jgi:hypothetical protein
VARAISHIEDIIKNADPLKAGALPNYAVIKTSLEYQFSKVIKAIQDPSPLPLP